MPNFVTPGQFVGENAARAPIMATGADLAVFVGVAARRLPDHPAEMPITGLASFDAFWMSGAPAVANADPLLAAVRLFFANGGRRLHLAAVAPSAATAAGYRAAVAGLGDIDAGMIAAPDARERLSAGDADTVMAALVGWAETAGTNRLALLDAPAGLDFDALIDWRQQWHSPDAAAYWPWLALPGGEVVPPSSAVAGIVAGSEFDRGIAKAPANIIVSGIAAPAVLLDSARLDMLNARNINCIRLLPGRGIRVWGARTLSPDPAWRFIPVRRLTRMIEVSAARGLAWVVFEPNGPALWARVREMLESFLFDLWRAGALMGNKPETAFFVRCDAATMSAADLAAGRLIAEIGLAPQRAAEFRLLRLAMNTA